MQTALMVKEISRVAKANSKSVSLRATIPSSIVEDLDLNIGDAISWETYTEKGETCVRIKKIKL
jgi:hypothetical protein